MPTEETARVGQLGRSTPRPDCSLRADLKAGRDMIPTPFPHQIRCAGSGCENLTGDAATILLKGWAQAAEPEDRVASATYVWLPKPRKIIERPPARRLRAEASQMPDYYTALAQKIQETRDDPVKIRAVVYEAARLALRWQVEEQWPTLSIIQSKIHIRELEDAIVRVEAGVAGPGGRDSREPAAAGLNAGQQSRKAPVKSEEDDAPNVVVAPHPQPRGPRPDLEAGAAGKDERGSREPAEATAGLNAIRQSRNATIESQKDAHFGIVKQLENAIERFASRQSRNAPLVSEKNGVPNEVAARPVERADLEAGAAGPDERGSREPAKAGAGFNAIRQSRNATIESKEDDVAFRVEAPHPQPGDDPPPAGQADLTGSRKLNPRPISRPYLVNPADFVNPALRLPVALHSGARMTGGRLMLAFQLAAAALAIAALYVAMWRRDTPTVMDTTTAAPKPSSARLAGPANGSNSVDAASLATLPAGRSNMVVAAPPTAAPLTAAPLAAPTDGSNTVAVALAAPVSFPRPTSYGVYAISDNRLIKLEQVHATPVDRRAGNQLQIIEPGLSVISSGTLTFVVFRRDLVSNAPEKVPLRIAARVSRSMNFDSAGKAVITTPVTETWIIRDQGYNLRVSPLAAEMVMLRSEDLESSFSSGRYALMLGGQAYDLVVAGEVIDPAHCVEGVATVRGLVFYECKPVLGPLK
jgi:hypothetical protein